MKSAAAADGSGGCDAWIRIPNQVQVQKGMPNVTIDDVALLVDEPRRLFLNISAPDLQLNAAVLHAYDASFESKAPGAIEAWWLTTQEIAAECEVKGTHG